MDRPANAKRRHHAENRARHIGDRVLGGEIGDPALGQVRQGLGLMGPERGICKQTGQERERDAIGHVDGPPVINRSIRGMIGEDNYLAKITGPIPLFFR